MGKSAFLISRRLFDHEIWRYPNKLRLWLYLIGNAVWKEEGVTIEGIKVGRGQVLKSFRKMQEDLMYYDRRTKKEIGLGTLKRYIDSFVSNSMLNGSFINDDLGTLYTIVNYDKWQVLANYTEYNSEHLAEHSWNTCGTLREQKEIRDIREIRDISNSNKDRLLIVKKIESYFIEKRGIGLPPSCKDVASIKSLLDDGIPLQTIKDGIDKAFARYSPAHNGDRIQSFVYCEKVIRNMHGTNNLKEGTQRETYQKVIGGNIASGGTNGSRDEIEQGWIGYQHITAPIEPID